MELSKLEGVVQPTPWRCPAHGHLVYIVRCNAARAPVGASVLRAICAHGAGVVVDRVASERRARARKIDGGRMGTCCAMELSRERGLAQWQAAARDGRTMHAADW